MRVWRVLEGVGEKTAPSKGENGTELFGRLKLI